LKQPFEDDGGNTAMQTSGNYERIRRDSDKADFRRFDPKRKRDNKRNSIRQARKRKDRSRWN
jgi:hypothetical protein